MASKEQILDTIGDSPKQILDINYPLKAYTKIDLSTTNDALIALNITEPDICQNYIDEVLNENAAEVAFGGYLETRNLYGNYSSFQKEIGNPRNIHLGMDFWTKAGTNVLAPIPGSLHSYNNNYTKGDYGPTIILEHKADNRTFYTLYGHLSLASLQGLTPGKIFEQGEMLGSLGETAINVNYAPHLHFQIIWDLGDFRGDYPGVCSKKELSFYRSNCPNPNLLLKL